MSEFLFMAANRLPWFWLCAMILFIVIEAVTFSLTTIWFAAGSLIMIFLSLLPISFRWQLLIFAALSLVMLFLTRPMLMKKLNSFRRNKTNVDALIGKEVQITKKITHFEKGEVKVSGVFWSAQNVDEQQEIDVGTICKIVAVQGNTLIVENFTQNGVSKN